MDAVHNVVLRTISLQDLLTAECANKYIPATISIPPLGLCNISMSPDVMQVAAQTPRINDDCAFRATINSLIASESSSAQLHWLSILRSFWPIKPRTGCFPQWDSAPVPPFHCSIQLSTR